jgi:leucyl aminopeptidase
MIHAVGRGSRNPPIMVNLFYRGNPNNPNDVTALIGKGVCFDAGGLNIKVENFYLY